MKEIDDNRSGIDALAKDGRVDYRLRRSGDYTSEETVALKDELLAYRRSHATSWGEIANSLGISRTALAELLAGKYQGDRQRLWRLVDELLADERARTGGYDIQAFASIGVARQIFGVIQCAIKQNSMAAVIGPSGSGKTVAARAFAADREKVVMIRIDEASGDSRGLTAALWTALKFKGCVPSHRKRLFSIIDHFRRVRSAIILVDEAQKLGLDGLETLRDVYDASDPDGKRNVPVVFFGDHNFMKLITRARAGESCSLRPQLSRRLCPVLSLEDSDGQGGGEPLFNFEDLVKILRNDKLRLVTDRGVRWLCSLANTPGWGSIGFAMAICRLTLNITKTIPIDIGDLRTGLRLAVGPAMVEDLGHSAGDRPEVRATG